MTDLESKLLSLWSEAHTREALESNPEWRSLLRLFVMELSAAGSVRGALMELDTSRRTPSYTTEKYGLKRTTSFSTEILPPRNALD